MNRRDFLRASSAAALSGRAARSQASDERARWIEIAESLKPRLRESTREAVRVVKPVADAAQFLRWRMEDAGPAATVSERVMRGGDSFILDFGDHLTGHVSFAIAGAGRGVDAPTRLKLTMGEAPAEVAEPLDPYKGTLSRAWLQDEVLNIDVLPSEVRMPRRYAFRYAKVEVVATSPNFGVRMQNFRATASTSAKGSPAPLPASASEGLRRIDTVSMATLRECMQTVFEDGPKRDRRLWIGDLRLQALTNYATFRNYDLVKRCLYLFAGLPREDGFVAACVFEDPKPLRGHEYIVDYAALYGAAVLDYAVASNDWDTAKMLWPVVRRQMTILRSYVGADGMFAAPKGSWVFIDWNNQLDRTAAMHGVYVYSLRQAAELARQVGAKEDAVEYGRLADGMTAAARSRFFDQPRRLFVSGAKAQVSWATQAWMVLAGIATAEEGRNALQAVAKSTNAVRPGAPYLYHYVAEAMLKCDMKREALELIEWYWGGMVKAGADTFWEVYDPANPSLSPYGSVLVNSYCHAWSCTPAYLLRSPGLL